ncbi:phospholipid scramblase 2-like [Mercenaria mercenaria]|uniref:phospholipid scramblase 2-like n=1 Tax=Mercenaria mercenaria TaxID=6596 RepID=UPI00234E5301|nr:phospholipid scramblase 2-like [Mercenaria mercenaria]XP_053409245.1 phospholipid scramblase 2-like [Mercenaria mercenaria]XP_053409248.1 phospholipid scramblase 2-like [Mercenaria mercenaria]
MSVVVAQPSEGQKGAGMPMTAMPEVQTIVLPHGLPPGLAYLGSLSEVKIHQHFDTLEVLSGFERNNKYQICNSGNQQFMYAKEDTDCLTRQCFGTMRPFTMNITDNNMQPLIQLYRPLKCVGSCMWCCCLQEMSIMSPPGVSIGSVKQIWTCWLPKYEVHDNQGNHLFTINGECCYCACCTDIMFNVSDAQGTEIGRITKHWGGLRELCGGVNDFSVQFPANMDVFQKTLLVGSTFLIDFIYFERNKN